jgi:hypothetical protein
MKLLLKLLFIFCVATPAVMGQELKTRNVIIITLDGYRWQELFEGADPKLMSDKAYSADQNIIAAFQGSNELQRREKLMPFFWNVIARQGQLYGNRNFRNKVNCANHHLLSYPGYSEMLVGFPERSISSNRKRQNPNATVLEFIHGHQAFDRKVAAFATWDVFPYILRENKVDFHVSAGNDIAEGKISENEVRLNKLLEQGQKRNDQYTFEYAFEYMKRERPRVMFIGFDETDHYAHQGLYDQYLTAAHEADKRIAQLWQWIQSQPDYKDQTTIFITTDHGRGKGHNTWKNHRLLAPGSRHIWFGVIGPDTPSFGELKFKGKYYQKQAAKTIAAFLGMKYETTKPAGEVVQTMMGVPQIGHDDAFSEHSRAEGLNNK